MAIDVRASAPSRACPPLKSRGSGHAAGLGLGPTVAQLDSLPRGGEDKHAWLLYRYFIFILNFTGFFMFIEFYRFLGRWVDVSLRVCASARALARACMRDACMLACARVFLRTEKAERGRWRRVEDEDK